MMEEFLTINVHEAGHANGQNFCENGAKAYEGDEEVAVEKGADGHPAERHSRIIQCQNFGGGVPPREDVEWFDHADVSFKSSPTELDANCEQGEKPWCFVCNYVYDRTKEDDWDEN